MSILTDLASAQVKRGVKTLYGRVMSRPAQLVSEGVNVVYACDVEIGPTDPTGIMEQYKQALTGLPDSEGFSIEDLLTTNTVLHNVSIANNNSALIYADVGAPVILTRSTSGQWEITGFSQEQPGTYFLVPVDLTARTIGSAIDVSLEARLLSFGEFGSLRPFGSIPLGASGIFAGNQLIKIV